MIDAITAEHRRLIGRMKFILDAMQPQGVQRLRKLEDGDEIDLNAALASMIDMRMGHQPDPRIMMRSVRKTRDISVLVLLDLSHSTNDKVAGPGAHGAGPDPVRPACCWPTRSHKVGDPFAIHGFCSDGRHDVNYWRFKDFDQPYDDLAKARLAGMNGQLSTRMGAAIRHATRRVAPAAIEQEAAAGDHRRRAGRRGRARPAVPAPRHQEGGGRGGSQWRALPTA